MRWATVSLATSVLSGIVGCGGGAASPADGNGSKEAVTEPDDSASGSTTTEGSSVETGDSPGDTGWGWLSWTGEETLTVDVFADGTPECVFRWKTTGLQVADPCRDCDFDFEVVAELDGEGSTCDGALPFVEQRWWRAGALYGADLAFDEAEIIGGRLSARRYRLELDATYGTPVASVVQVEAYLQ